MWNWLFLSSSSLRGGVTGITISIVLFGVPLLSAGLMTKKGFEFCYQFKEIYYCYESNFQVSNEREKERKSQCPFPPWGSRETHKDAVKQLFLSLARLKSDLDSVDLPFKSLQTPCLYFSTCVISYSGSYLTFNDLVDDDVDDDQ